MRHADSRARARTLAGYGMDAAGIATLLGIDAAAVRTCYAGELREGLASAEAKVREALHRKAMAGDRAALKLLRG